MDSLKPMQKLKTKKESSFTLLELLVVIAVIAILAAIVLVSLSSANQRAWEARGMNFSQNVRTTLATDLVGEWSFDGGSGTQASLIDDSGNGNNGTWNDVDPSPWYDKGKIRKAGQFFGDNYVSVLSSQSLNTINGSMTVEAWINPATINNIIVQRFGAEGGAPYWRLGLLDPVDGKARFALRGTGGGEPKCASTSIISANKWYHIVGVRDITADTLSIYINGAKENSISDTSIGSLPLTNPLWIGVHGQATPTGNYFNGFIDEVRIYKTALTAKQIQQLYAEGLPRHLTNYK